MNERCARLLASLDGLEEDLILEAAEDRAKKRRRWPRRLVKTLAACAAVAVIGVGALYLIPTGAHSGGSNVGGKGSEPRSFLFYEGPVLPLTLRDAREDISAERSVTLDFAGWDLDGTELLIRDSYTLKNSSGEDRTVRALYPFIERFSEVSRRRPALTLDGTELEAGLLAGYYAGGYEGPWKGSIGGDENEGSVNMNYPDFWEDYRDLLADGSYFAAAVSPYPDFSGVTAWVYDLTDPWYTLAEGQEAARPVLRITFPLDYTKTRLLYTGGFSGWSLDDGEGWMRFQYDIPGETNGSYKDDGHRTIVAVGEEPGALTIEGFTAVAEDRAQPMEAGAAVTRREVDLEEYLRSLALERYGAYDGQEGRPDFETVYGQFKLWLVTDGPLAREPKERYRDGNLNFGEVASVDRVLWLEAEITVPAGESVTLTAELKKTGSSDPFRSRGSVGGAEYELATRLGSNLAFTNQTATLEDRGKIEIICQNFGFDLKKGVKTVDLTGEIYFLEVTARSDQ